MKKHLLLADLHLHHLPSWRLEWCGNFIDEIIKKQKEGFKDLYILGDVFELRDNLDARVLNQFLKLVLNWENGDVVWITGQHDSYLPGKATLHELEGKHLEDGNIIVIDSEPYTGDNKIWFVPYQREVEKYLNQLKKIPDGAIVLTHYPIDEALPFPAKEGKLSVKLKDFKRFKMTISGDIHTYQDYTNPEFHYVGTPSQRDWRDRNVKGQVGVLEGDKFYRLPTEHPSHIEVDSPDDIPKVGEYIVKIKKGYSESLKNSNVISYTETVEKIDTTIVHNSVDSMVRIRRYLEMNPPQHDIGLSIEYAENIIKEVQ